MQKQYKEMTDNPALWLGVVAVILVLGAIMGRTWFRKGLKVDHLV